MNKSWLFLSCLMSSLAATSRALTVEVEIPQINAAEYHRPYVAVWVEDSERNIVEHLALWLEQEKWHRDLRYWWRRGGKRIELPIDGVSGATRKPGKYVLQKDIEVKPGQSLIVEAVREVGGRELIKIPLNESLVAHQGQRELGLIKVSWENR
ncbi:DUF2271 domain-containing protein [Agaribacterium haliotis]|uniref:DUF2271 domain-containing protein n=1 Tax=Agaribacterium haliotis TaxID=2013869 RepID=UPI000BB57299|nr:DUF2271 domain-containing protein [Agaribacterium haliotis]